VEAKPTDNPVQSSLLKSANRLIKIVGNAFFGVMVLMVVMMVFFVIQNKLSGGPPKVAGHHMYMVLSGSMAPAFDTGSLTFVKPVKPEQIKEGDIITFNRQSYPGHPVFRVSHEFWPDFSINNHTWGIADNF